MNRPAPQARRCRSLLALPLMCLISLPSYAYETDQLTARAAPLEDARAAANAEVDVYIAAAVTETNAALGCHATTERTRRRLAAELYERLARPTPVRDRGPVDSLGFGAYGAFLETAPIARRDFRDRSDIYGRLNPTESLILGTVGVCSTIRLAGVLMGTDKPDHFFAQGYDYYRESHWGRSEHRALVWGTASERGAYGLLTSDAFSFADLHANRRGYTFYAGLLRAGSGLKRGKDGCVVAVHGFDWADWVDDAYDELLNPSVFGPQVAAHVNGQLAENRAAICEGYRHWGADVKTRRARIAAVTKGDATAKAPPRPDWPDFNTLCGLEPPDVVVPFDVAVGPVPAPGTAADPVP